MLRYGIPAYRLPPDLLDQEIDQIRVLGIPIHTGAAVGSLEAFRKDYDAVFLGLGTQRSRLIQVDGVQQPFVLGGIDFLRAVRSGEQVRVGPRVVVIGGGDVSIDVALTALRQGATHVDLTSLEKRRDMPASPHEIELAVAEGVQLHAGWGPVRIEEDGEVTFQFCERVKDENGKFDPKFDAARLLKLEADHVILATGQGTDLAILEGSGVESARGFIVADPKTLMTNIAGRVRRRRRPARPAHGRGGDPRRQDRRGRYRRLAAWGGDGRQHRQAGASRRAHPLDGPGAGSHSPAPCRHAREERRGGPRRGQLRPDRGGPDRRDGARRGPPLPALRRLHRLRPVHGDLQRDGHRGAAHGRHPGRPARLLRLPAAGELCIGCGACTQVCPTGAIRIEDRDGVRRTIITGTVVREQPLLACSECGAPTQTPAHREFVRRRLPDHMAALLDRELCPSCARLRADRPMVVGRRT